MADDGRAADCLKRLSDAVSLFKARSANTVPAETVESEKASPESVNYALPTLSPTLAISPASSLASSTRSPLAVHASQGRTSGHGPLLFRYVKGLESFWYLSVHQSSIQSLGGLS